MKHSWPLLLLLPLVACAPEEPAPVDTGAVVPETEWWVVEDGTPIDTGVALESSASIVGSLALAPKGYAGPAQIQVWENGELSCDVDLFLTEMGPAGSCELCSVQMELSASEVEIRSDTGCGLVGIDPAYLAGETMSMGGNNGVLYMQLEDGWEPVGVVDQEQGRFEFEVRFE